MRKVKSKKFTEYNRLSFLTLPIVFTLLSFLLLYLAFQPILEPAFAAAQLLISQQKKPNNESKNLLELEGVGGLLSAGEVVPLSKIKMPYVGDQYGQLKVDGTAVDVPLFWGDRPEDLNKGVGTYTGAWLPGFGKTVLLAGHTGTYFNDMESVKLGSTISVETHYGTYTYEVVDMAVKKANDETAYDFARQDENIILYTCYPFRYIGVTDERYFVYGTLVEGNPVDTNA